MTSLNQNSHLPARLSHDWSCSTWHVLRPMDAANCVTALPIDPPIAGASTGFAPLKTSQGKSPCAVRYATGIPAALTSSHCQGSGKGFPPYCKPLTVGSILKAPCGPKTSHVNRRESPSASLLHHTRSFVAQDQRRFRVVEIGRRESYDRGA